MQQIPLTWDLVLLSAFVMIFMYNFLLGQNSTIKLILSIYIAVLTADGIITLIEKVIFLQSPGFQDFFQDFEIEFFTATRILIFFIAVVIFVIKGAFHIKLERHRRLPIRTLIHTLFCVLSSVLFLATILIYLSGSSFVEGMLIANRIPIYEQSYFARILIDYYQLWFSLPAVAFLITGFLFEVKD